MREAIGGTWVMQLVITFMLVFVAFLALSLNYSKAFKIKNEVLTMIEKKEGFNNGTIELINNYLSKNGYHTMKQCSENSWGVNDLTKTTAQPVPKGDTTLYYYCVEKVSSKSANLDNKAYYKVNLFFYFNLPVLGDIFKFTINGSTNDIIVPNDIS